MNRVASDRRDNFVFLLVPLHYPCFSAKRSGENKTVMIFFCFLLDVVPISTRNLRLSDSGREELHYKFVKPSKAKKKKTIR